MAAASSSAGLPQRALALLDVALRVPCVFIIDSIFNSHSPTGPGPGGPGPGGPGPGGPGPAGWSGASGSGPVVVRVLGVLLSLVVLLLSQKALLRFYRLFLAVILAMAAILINYYATSHVDVSFSAAALAFQQRSSAPWLWLAVVAVQLLLALGYVFLLELRWLPAALVVLDVLVPLWGLMVQLPPDLRRLVAGCCGGALAVNTGAVLAARLRWFYYSCRYVYLLLRHMYRIYGLQLLLEDTWRRIRLPHVLRLFWLTRLAAQALILLYVVRAVRRESGHATGGTAIDGGSASQAFLPPWDVLWDLCSNLIISGCDSTLTVLGMSSVISSLAHYLGLSILLFIGSTEEEDKRLGFVAPVLFFILALQTGLSSLDPEERLVRLSRNLCLLLTAVLHFIHGMTDPVLMSLSASQVWSVRRHLPVLLVSLSLFLLPVALTHFLWRHYVLNTWLFAVSAFCVELCLKVLVSLTVYGLFLCDGVSGSLWEGLDDYVYYVRSGGSVMEFLFGVLMFGNGAYTMMFESGSKIRACMMLLHAYFNIYLQARSGWRTFTARRAAVARINSLPEARGEALRRLQDVCAICYQEFSSSARVTPCHHYFHALCLRKWLYIQDTCPMCHQRVYVEDDAPNADPASNNNMAAAAAEAPPPAEPAPPPGEDNDSIEYDEDEWEEPQTGDTPLEEDYINDQDTEDTED